MKKALHFAAVIVSITCVAEPLQAWNSFSHMGGGERCLP